MIIDITKGKKHQGYIQLRVDSTSLQPLIRFRGVDAEGEWDYNGPRGLVTINGGSPMMIDGQAERRNGEWLVWSKHATQKQDEYLRKVLTPHLDEVFATATKAFLAYNEHDADRAEQEARKLDEVARKKHEEAKLLRIGFEALNAGKKLPTIKAVDKFGEAGHGKDGQHAFSKKAIWGTIIFFDDRPVAHLSGALQSGYGYVPQINGQAAFEWVKHHEYLWNEGRITLWEG